jgi:hypothetical protein
VHLIIRPGIGILPRLNNHNHYTALINNMAVRAGFYPFTVFLREKTELMRIPVIWLDKTPPAT